MLGALIKALGTAGAIKSATGGGDSDGKNIGDTIKTVEQTETGQYALSLAKGTVTAILIIVGVGGFLLFRSTSNMFGEQKKQMAASQNATLRTRLFDYYKEKYPEKSDAEITNEVNLVL